MCFYQKSEIRRLDKSFQKALHLSGEEHRKIVMMSDCHRGCGTRADSFLNNRPIYTAALKHYYGRGFTYIELGDGDELWENRRFSDVYNTHREIYDLFYKFHHENRLFMIFGNHDRVKENAAFVWQTDHTVIPFYESIILDLADKPPLFLFHGYQGDVLNDRLWKLSRFLVRYLWRPLELTGINDPTSAAKNYTKIRRTEERFLRYSKMRKCIVTCGHTHKPGFITGDNAESPGEHEGIYFNCGSCVHPNALTAIELTDGLATLVKWTICSRSDMTLYVCKEIIKEMPL